MYYNVLIPSFLSPPSLPHNLDTSLPLFPTPPIPPSFPPSLQKHPESYGLDNLTPYREPLSSDKGSRKIQVLVSGRTEVEGKQLIIAQVHALLVICLGVPACDSWKSDSRYIYSVCFLSNILGSMCSISIEE